ncbi:MAG: SGNH/GDSL hydrolase family protein [Clostridia bacterium]|nr:SGNH/GDSL hydrolase family protein [Clostridia bacterium]
MNDIIILGDSIARGLVYDEAQARYRICRDTFMNVLKNAGARVKNLARVGGTVLDAADLFEKCEKPDGAYLVIETGSNDSDLVWADVAARPDVFHDARVPLDMFRHALRALIIKARACGLKPLVTLPVPVRAQRYFEWFSRGLDSDALMRYLGTTEYIYRWQERYAYAAQSAADETRCPVFDLRSAFLFERNLDSLMCADGIHPNESGHAVITREVGRLLETGVLAASSC